MLKEKRLLFASPRKIDRAEKEQGCQRKEAAWRGKVRGLKGTKICTARDELGQKSNPVRGAPIILRDNGGKA